jgi:hypothetical protein
MNPELPHAAPHLQRPVEPLAGERVPHWAETLTRWLDDALRVPGTKIGFGLDAILGFLAPGLGDAATGVASLGLLLLAFKRGLPRVVLARMLGNLALDAVLGAVPVVGDLFDVAWKANRKNLELIEQHEHNPSAKAGFGDYALVIGGVLLVLLSIALPIAFVAWLAGGALHGFGK